MTKRLTILVLGVALMCAPASAEPTRQQRQDAAISGLIELLLASNRNSSELAIFATEFFRGWLRLCQSHPDDCTEDEFLVGLAQGERLAELVQDRQAQVSETREFLRWFMEFKKANPYLASPK